MKHKWENAMTLDKQSWGYRRNATANDYLTIADVSNYFSTYQDDIEFLCCHFLLVILLLQFALFGYLGPK